MSNIRTSSFFVLKPLLIKEFLHLEEQIDQLFAKPKKLKVELKELIQEIPIRFATMLVSYCLNTNYAIQMAKEVLKPTLKQLQQYHLNHW